MVVSSDASVAGGAVGASVAIIASVGAVVGASVGMIVGASVGITTSVGFTVGACVAGTSQSALQPSVQFGSLIQRMPMRLSMSQRSNAALLHLLFAEHCGLTTILYVAAVTGTVAVISVSPERSVARMVRISFICPPFVACAVGQRIVFLTVARMDFLEGSFAFIIAER